MSLAVEAMTIPRASEFIKRLQELILEHGDLSILVEDADTGWDLAPGLVFSAQSNDSKFKEFLITSSYNDTPDGRI